MAAAATTTGAKKTIETKIAEKRFLMFNLFFMFTLFNEVRLQETRPKQIKSTT